MKGTDVNQVLKAWHKLEAIAPGEVPKNQNDIKGEYFTDKENRSKIRLLNLSGYAWTQEQLQDTAKFTLQFHYYVACFEQHELIRFFREYFNSKEEIINHSAAALYSFTFSADNEGKYIKDSMFVPFAMYMAKLMRGGSPLKYEEIIENYREQMRRFEEQAVTVFANGINEKSITEMQRVYADYFCVLQTNQMNYLEKELIRKDSQSDKMNFNSFYLEDLEQIINKGENETLRTFIKGSNSRIDVNENREYIEDVLQPKYMPAGRWPSPVEHRLSLMQQVAVNQVLNNDQSIHSVNGPPGTGKTTLLKDIFANIVIKRAEAMMKFKDPATAFQKNEAIDIDGYKHSIYLMDDSLKGFSMVVASSNNGAVENISKELPQKKEIIRSAEDNEYRDSEEKYAEEAVNLSFYPKAAEQLLGGEGDAWGLFSSALGKSSNIAEAAWALAGKKDDPDSFLAQIKEDSKKHTIADWKNTVQEFQELYSSINLKKEKLQLFAEEFKMNQEIAFKITALKNELPALEKEEMEANAETAYLHEQKKLTEQQIQAAPKPPLFQRMLGKKTDKVMAMEEERDSIFTKLKEENEKLHSLRKRLIEKKAALQKLSKEQESYNEELHNYEKQKLVLPTDQYWENSQEAYEKRQQQTIWLTDELNFERGLLFLKAMKVHKIFLVLNEPKIRSAIRLLINHKKLNLNESINVEYLKNMWQVVHLITPVVSTTFASFGLMYRGVGTDFISYLFIDEAGQASPQQAAGALWRSKKAVVVGDPIQIEPVVSTDQTILADIRKAFQISERHIGLSASVQSLADQANPFGMMKKAPGEDGQWIGTPLWVHRRCLKPMFTIANDMAYNNNMVLADSVKKIGKGAWIDCKGRAVNRQYVKEQGTLVAERIGEQWVLGENPPDIFVITPFTAVRAGVKEAVRKKLKAMGVPKKDMDDWLGKSIGTVHTFQGKEADIVYFVAGTDKESDGAANWSCSKPNLLNVAVTRAKKEFYIIGDYERISPKQYYEIIAGQLEVIKMSAAH